MKKLLESRVKNIQICMAFLIFQAAYAQQIVSTFSVDAEGWTVIKNDGEGNFGRGNGPEYFSTSGNPGGHIEIVDNIPGAYTVVAPPKFLGDLSLYKNGIISFEARAVSGTVLPERVEFGMVTISSTNGEAQLDIAPTIPSDSAFTLYSVNLTDSIWHKTAAEWDLILSNITAITIVLEYSIAGIGDDRVAFDNFKMGLPNVLPPPCLNGQIYICHRASGNNEKSHAICIDGNAVAGHLKHGDYYGACFNKNGGVESSIEEAVPVSFDEETFSIFPNPFNNSLTINMVDMEESDFENIEIKFYDFIGRSVMDISGIESVDKEIDMSALKDGIYTYRILNDHALIQSGKLKKGM